MKKIKAFGKEYAVIDLEESLGIKNLVFDLVTAVEFILDAANFGEKILGGDILRKIDGEFTYSYDNWYSDSQVINETRDIALDFLRVYLQQFPVVDWIVSITTSNY